MSGRHKSTLFLMEQIVAIVVFAACAAVCCNILAAAYSITQNAVDTKNALLAAESAAECLVFFNGDEEKITQILNGEKNFNGVRVYYNKNWQPVFSDAVFVLQLEGREIIVKKISTDEELINLTVRRST
jgi:hypothetical protein